MRFSASSSGPHPGQGVPDRQDVDANLAHRAQRVIQHLGRRAVLARTVANVMSEENDPAPAPYRRLDLTFDESGIPPMALQPDGIELGQIDQPRIDPTLDPATSTKTPREQHFGPHGNVAIRVSEAGQSIVAENVADEGLIA